MERNVPTNSNRTLLSIKGEESISFDQGRQWVGGTTYFCQLYEGFLSSGLLTSLHGTAIKILLALVLKASRLGVNPYGTPEQVTQTERFFQDLVRKSIVAEQDRGRLFCYVDHEELARIVGVSDKTLTKYANQLHAYNLVERRSVRRGSYEYVIYFIEPAAYVDKYNTLHPRVEKGSIGDSTTEGSVVSPDQVTTNLIGKTATTTAVGTGLSEQAILDHFAARKGTARYQPTAHDRVALQELRHAGVSQAQVIAAIDQVFDARSADAPPIRMFSYCANALLKQAKSPSSQGQACQGALSQEQIVPCIEETAPDAVDAITALYQAEIGQVSPTIEQKLAQLVRRHPHLQAWEYAFKEAATNNIRKLSYVESILNRLTGGTGQPVPTRSSTHGAKRQQSTSRGSSRAKDHRLRAGRATDGIEAMRERARQVIPLDVAEVLGTGDA
jgi:hypothetical protein